MRFLTLILFILFALPTQAQEVLSTFHGYGDITSSTYNGVSGKFDLTINFNGGYYKDGKYPADSLQVGDKIWFDYGFYIVDTIHTITSPIVTIVAFDSTLTRPKPSLNSRVIFTRDTPNKELLVFMRQSIGGSGITANEFVGLLNHVIMLIDADTTGNGTSSFSRAGPVLDVPEVGDTIPSTTVAGWIDRAFYFVAPSISISLAPTTTVYEVGDSTQITISGATTNPSSTTLSGGELNMIFPTTGLLSAFGASATYNSVINYTPKQGGVGTYNTAQYSFQASQDWDSGTETGSVTSTTATIYGVYPVLYGMSATDLSVGGDPYTTLTKLVEREGDKTVTLTGSGYIYFAVPKTWGDYTLSQIIDHNGFDVTPSFTAYDITVGSTGLTNDWTAEPYKLYKLNTTTITSGYAYQFIR